MTFALNVKLSVRIFDELGIPVVTVMSPSTPMAPGETNFNIQAMWPAPVVSATVRYTHTSILVYSVLDTDTGKIVDGVDGSKSGSFATPL